MPHSLLLFPLPQGRRLCGVGWVGFGQMGGQRQKYSRSFVTVIDEKLLFTILIALMPQERATELHILKSHYIFYDRFNRHLQILARERVKDLPVNEHVCDFEKKNLNAV